MHMDPPPITPAVQRKLQPLLKQSGKSALAVTAFRDASFPGLIIPAELLIIHHSLHRKPDVSISKHVKEGFTKWYDLCAATHPSPSIGIHFNNLHTRYCSLPGTVLIAHVCIKKKPTCFSHFQIQRIWNVVGFFHAHYATATIMVFGWVSFLFLFLFKSIIGTALFIQKQIRTEEWHEDRHQGR